MNFKIMMCLSALLLIGCSQKSGGGSSGAVADPAQTKNPVPIAVQPGDWKKTASESADGKVKLTRYDVSDEALAEARNEYRRANLIQLPIDAKYNADVLRITDTTVEEYRNKAFIAPRVYSYGSQDGGTLLPIDHGDGTVTISFNVAFLDGITPEIMAPSANGKGVTVPNFFTVKDPDGLAALLKNEYGADNGLAPLPGCPKQLTLIAIGHEYDVTPSDLARGDFCQLNVPVTISLTITRAEAEQILEQGLESNTVDLRAIYETKVSYPTSKISISFDRAKILSDLRVELALKVGFVDADAKIAIKKVMQKQLMQVSIQGDVLSDSRLQDLINKVESEFIEPWTPTPEVPQNPCGSAPFCLRFSDVQTDESSTLDFEWANESNLMSGQNYLTTTKLKSTPTEVSFGEPTSQCVSTPDHTCKLGLPNTKDVATGDFHAFETGLTVMSGNLIKIEPTLLSIQQRDFGSRPPERTDDNVCVSSHPECTEHSSEGCHGHGGCRLSEDELELRPTQLFSAPLPNTCTNVCDRTENHWLQVTTYYQNDAVTAVNTNVIGAAQVIYGGLYFRFQWTDVTTGNPKTLDCLAETFPSNGEGKSMSFRLMNMPTCAPFAESPGQSRTLSIINEIRYPVQYKQGRYVTRWDGSVSETPTDETFYPRVDLSAIVSIPGYRFESSGEEKSQFVTAK